MTCELAIVVMTEHSTKKYHPSTSDRRGNCSAVPNWASVPLWAIVGNTRTVEAGWARFYHRSRFFAPCFGPYATHTRDALFPPSDRVDYT